MNENERNGSGEARNLEWIYGHRMRQRERSQNGAWDDFRNHELLEVLLGYVVPRQDMSRQARELTHRFGSVLDVLRAPKEALLEVEGMTPAMVGWLNLTGELVSLYCQADDRERISMFRFGDVYDFLKPRLSWARPPECWALYTNFEDCLISCQRMPDGRTWWSPANVRAMVEDCVSLQARNLIIVVFRKRRPVWMNDLEKEHLRSINSTFNALQVALLDCVLVNAEGAHSMSLHERFEFTRPDRRASGLFSPDREES